MNRIRTRYLGSRQDGFPVEIGFRRAIAAEGDRQIRCTHMQRTRIRGRIDGNGFYPHRLRGSHYPHRDFPAIGDQQGFNCLHGLDLLVPAGLALLEK